MKIRFAGLIAHATLDMGLPNERQYAALIADTAHKPTLSLLDVFIDAIDPTLPRDTSGDVVCIPLSGCVTIPAMGTGACTVDRASLPSLLTVTNGTTRSLEIDRCPPAPGVFHAVVQLPPGGLLEPDDYYLCQASFNGTGFGCLPRVMRYLLNTAGAGTIEIIINGRFLRVMENAEVLITNISPQSGGTPIPPGCTASASPTSHYLLYSKFFDPPATTVYAPAQNGGCSFGTSGVPLPACAVPADLDIDCSNSRFP